jgi:hypothetical protein
MTLSALPLRSFLTGLTFAFLSLLLLAGCEDPSLTVKAKPDETLAPGAVAPTTNIPVVNSAPLPPADTAAPASSSLSESPAAEQGPELTVQWRGEEIVISGAIRSFLQRDRIGEEMGAAFGGTRIVNELEVDTSRIAVGWGNRITEALLIFYFKEIDKAYFSYKDGIITLRGETTKANLIKEFQELTVSVVSGELSRDIVNEIKVVQ